jgi:hypothetical protein
MPCCGGTAAGASDYERYCCGASDYERHYCREERGSRLLQAALLLVGEKGRSWAAGGTGTAKAGVAGGNGCGCGALFVAAMWQEKLRKRACGFDMVPGVISFSDKIWYEYVSIFLTKKEPK